MPLIVVTSSLPGDGKTGVAAAVARHYAYQGRNVRLARVATDEGNAEADAAFFASLTFAPGSPAEPVSAAAVSDPGSDDILVVEAGAAALPALPGGTVVLVTRDAESSMQGVQPTAVVRTAVPCARLQAALGESKPPAIVLPEDRTLAGFSVAEAKALLNAELIVPGEDEEPTCDHLVIAPITSDAGQPYFRRFGTQAVVVRFDRTDMHLAAMQADPSCLILTGGRKPSDYLFDAATAKGIPVMLSATDTENTVMALEGVFDRTRFQGERKLDRMAELLESSSLFNTLPA